MSSKFLDAYKEKNPETTGIPYVEMNAPLVQNAVDGHVGIELEIEGRNLINTGQLDGVKGTKSGVYWQSKEDGSLRGGREYVMSGPCQVDEIAPLVNGFFDRAKSADMRFNNSNRCSTHVHVNVSGLKVNALTSILALWTVFESALIAWCGEERTANHFCLSTKDEDSFVEAWTLFLKSGTNPAQVHNGLKYTALNILPIWTQGSIEFRCGEAPSDPKRIINWASFLWTLCKYAADKYPNPHQIAFDISERGALEIFRDICGEGSIDEEFFLQVVSIYEDSFDRECLENFRNAQPFVLGFPWDDWEEEINKAFVPNPFTKKTIKKRGRL